MAGDWLDWIHFRILRFVWIFVDCLLIISHHSILMVSGGEVSAFCQLCIPLCGRFGPIKGRRSGLFVDRVWSKYAAKWVVCFV